MNKKGHCLIPVLAIVGAGTGGTITSVVVMSSILNALILGPAVWHIPAWTEAKKNHTEAMYQMQQMWPQGYFGTQNKMPSNAMGNGGNFKGGNSEVR